MRAISRFFFPLVLLLSTLQLERVQAQDSGLCEKLEAFVKTLEKWHYDPPQKDDIFSRALYKNFFQHLDPQGLYLSQKSLEELGFKPATFWVSIRQDNCANLSKIQTWFMEQLDRAEARIETIASEKFSFSPSDTLLNFSKAEENNFPRDEANLEQTWRTWFKLEMIREIVTQSNLDSLEMEPLIKEVQAYSAENVLKTKEQALCQIRSQLNSAKKIDQYFEDALMSAMSINYDPHTLFLNLERLTQFENSLSQETLSFGLHLIKNDQGEMEVQELIPGGAAWKSNLVHKGDIIQRVVKANQEEVQWACLEGYELEERLNSLDTEYILLKIKKRDGRLKELQLRKTKLRNQDNIVNSFFLQGEKKVAYIALPGFYPEDEAGNYQGCAQDVASELIKLKREGLEGLILDLRNNGGGSLQEALELAGIFIPQGPLALSRSRNQAPAILRDPNRGSIYTGPMILLINQYSASASEIVAGALRDYERALIVGQKSFGKASGQIIIPLLSDPEKLEQNDVNPEEILGFVKITTDRYYQLNGKSHQLMGIKPDVELSKNTGFLGEQELPGHLFADTVMKKVFFSPAEALPRLALRQSSQARLEKSTEWQKWEQLRQAFVDQEAQLMKQALRTSDLLAFLKERQRQYLALDTFSKSLKTPFEISVSKYTQEIFEIDPDLEVQSSALQSEMRQDIELFEAYKLMQDFIKLQK